MQNLIIPKNHILTKYITEVKGICSPFLDATGLTHFHYARFFPNATCFTVSNNPEWQQYFFTHFMNQDVANFGRSGSEELVFLPSRHPLIANNAKKYFNIDYMLSFEIASKTHYDIFSFATSPSYIKIIDYYFNFTDELRQFIAHFKVQAHAILEEGANNPFQWKPCQFVNSIWQDVKGGLTEKELACLYYLAQGLSAKQIAIQLQISHRTVEAHLYNVKSKTGYHKKGQLISFFLSTFEKHHQFIKKDPS